MWAPLLVVLISLALITQSPTLSRWSVGPFYIDTIRLFMVLLTLWIITPSAYLISGVIRRLVILSLGIFLVLTFRVFNPLLFYLTFETTLIPITLLILGWGYQPERIIAAKYILLYTLFGSLPLLLILILSTQFTTIFSPVIIKITLVRPLFLVMAFLIKLPMYGAHLWLPKAHVEAPVIGRVLLAAILLKMGFMEFGV